MRYKRFKWVVATLLFLFILNPAIASETPLECLARAIYHEARGEPLKGKIAVAWVIMNRITTNGFPVSICKVIAQPGQFPWFAKNPKEKDLKSYQESVILAEAIIDGEHPDPTDGAVYFQSVRDAGHGRFRTRIGSHYFFLPR